MKKMVNGKVVDITNMPVFEAGFEGVALNPTVANSISTGLADAAEDIEEITGIYSRIMRELPFPLYGIENDVKYAALGMCIHDEINKPLEMWVDNALYIRVDESRAIKFLAKSWGIINDSEKHYNNVNIENFRGDVGYREFEWVTNQLMQKKSLATYYSVFMPKFMQACENEPMVMRWELGRIMDFGYTPEKMELPINKIVDSSEGVEYFLDVYAAGFRKTGRQQLHIKIDKKDKPTCSTKEKSVRVYNFDVYGKVFGTKDEYNANTPTKIKRNDLEGFAGIFETIIAKGVGANNIEDIKYSGVVVRDKIVYGIAGSLYCCGFNKYIKPVEIARNIDIYSVECDKVYISRSKKLDSGVTKETIYSYDVVTQETRLCKQRFLKQL